jgi:hypothetical protein
LEEGKANKIKQHINCDEVLPLYEHFMTLTAAPRLTHQEIPYFAVEAFGDE